MFRATTELIQPRKVSKHHLYRDDALMSYFEVLQLWRLNDEFCEFFANVLADSPFDAFRWETPPLTLSNVHQPFAFVLVDSPDFVSRQTDEESFSEYFTENEADEGVVSFNNLRGDATLVVPSPRKDSDAYGHLAAFVRFAPKKQVTALWRIVGEVLTSEINDDPIWLSTAGGGVAWLHVRLDVTPKYYCYSPFKKNPN